MPSIARNQQNAWPRAQFRARSNFCRATRNQTTPKRDAHIAPQVIVFLSCPTSVSIKDTWTTRPSIGGIAETVGAATGRTIARVTGDNTDRGRRRRDPSRSRRRASQGREGTRGDAVGSDISHAWRGHGAPRAWLHVAGGRRVVSSKGCRVTAATLRTELSRKGGASKPRTRD